MSVTNQEAGKSRYNPATDKADGLAAKAWELLRRNPTFRIHAEYLMDPKRAEELGFKSPTPPEELLQNLDSGHPLAAYALRWLFAPAYFDPTDLGMHFNVPPGYTRVEILGATFPHLSDGEINEIMTMGWDKFGQIFPFYLQRHDYNFSTESLRNSYPEAIRGPWFSESDRNNYPGPLCTSGGPFNLNTPWPETPHLFRKHFQWLWCHFDYAAKSPYTGDRRFFLNPVEANWLIDQIVNVGEAVDNLDYFRVEQLRFFTQNFQVFAIPRLLYSETDLRKAMETWDQLNGKMLRFFSAVIHANKWNSLLGGDADWRAFCFYWGKVRYNLEHFADVHSPCRYSREGSGVALGKLETFERRHRDHRLTSKIRPHLESRCRRMENLMFAIYPGFSVKELIRLSTQKKPEESRALRSANLT